MKWYNSSEEQLFSMVEENCRPPPTSISVNRHKLSVFLFRFLALLAISAVLSAVVLLIIYPKMNGRREAVKIESGQPPASPSSTDLSTSDSATINWPLYTNEGLGYSIKYPIGWFQRESEARPETGPNNNLDVYFQNRPISLTDIGGEKVDSFWVIKKSEHSAFPDLMGWWASYSLRFPNKYSDNDLNGFTLVDGSPALKVESRESQETIKTLGICCVLSYVIGPNKEILEIGMNITDRRNPNYFLFDQMLATFKWLGEKAGPANEITGRLAYIEYGVKVLIFENGQKSVVTSGLDNLSNLRWSKDGQYLGWINNGFSVSVFEAKTGKITEIVKPAYSNDEPEKSGRYKLSDFDFSPDGRRLVYVRDGVWLTNLTGGEAEKILANKSVELIKDNPTADEYYSGVDWQPNGDTLLLKTMAWSCNQLRLYDIKLKGLVKMEDFDKIACRTGKWSDDGKMIIGADQQIGFARNLLLTEVAQKKTVNVYDKLVQRLGFKENQFLYISEGIVDSEGNWLLSLKPTPSGESWPPPILSGNGLYRADKEYGLHLILESSAERDYNRFDLALTPDGRNLTYLLDPSSSSPNGYDLHLLGLDENEIAKDKIILSNVYEYVWSDQ